MKDAITDLEKVYRIQDQGDYLLPNKTVLKWPGKDSEETKGRINAMACYLGGDVNLCGIKWIGSGPNNPRLYDMPRASALIILNDPVTMAPKAVMDGAIISAMRTGAVTGVCSKYLAPANSKIVSLFGAGVQNRTQIMALMSVIPSIQTVRVYDYYYERSVIFAQEMGKRLNVEMQPVRNREDMFKDADILVTATTATEPVIFDREIQKGCYVAHLGGREVDDDVILRSNKIVVDNWEVSRHRGGDTLADLAEKGVIGDKDIYASVEELVVGKKAPRANEQERTYTCNVGLGTYDIALASRVYNNAINSGKGKMLELWENPNWV